MSSPEHKQLIWNLIKDIKVGMLVTKETNDEDSIRARPMSLVQDAYDGTLYFYTSKNASKAFEVEQDRDVCLTFSSPSDNVYVSLTGKARISQDQQLIDKYWNPYVAAWFENGKDNPEVAMLIVKISKGEHWDSTTNKLVQTFEILKSNVVKSSTPNIGENEKFGEE
jgi:general stress protein 26